MDDIGRETHFGSRLLDNLRWDVRNALRMIRRKPVFAGLAIGTLALGIGVNTAVFTLFNLFVLKPVPVSQPEQLVHVKRLSSTGELGNLFSWSEFREYAGRNRTLSDLAAYNKVAVRPDTNGTGRTPLTEGADFVNVLMVSGRYFSMLGGRPQIGRVLGPQDDEAPGAHPVAVLSHGYWVKQYGGDPSLLGRTIRLNGFPFTVVGIAEKSFVGTEPQIPDVWLPLMMRDSLIGPAGWGYRKWYSDRAMSSVLLMGRLRSGTTISRAEADFRVVAAQLAATYSEIPKNSSVSVRSAASLIDLNASYVPLVVPIALAVLLVLLIACANVANLMLARAASRQREMAIRLAIGAKPRQLMRQLLAECAVIGLLGGVLGLTLSTEALNVVQPWVARQLPAVYQSSFTMDMQPDARVFVYTLLLSLATALIFGMVPSLEASRSDAITAIKSGSSMGQRLSQTRLRNTLVVAQVAVSFVLLISAGLLIRSLVRLQQIDLGFTPGEAISASVNLDGVQRDPARETAARRLLLDRLRQKPGIQASEAVGQVLTGRPMTTTIQTVDSNGGGASVSAGYNLVSADYYSTLGLHLLRGRLPEAREVQSGTPVCVITESTGKRLWAAQNPLGKRLRVGKSGGGTAPTGSSYEVVGIIRDTRSGLVWEPDTAFVYLPLPLLDTDPAHLLIRADSATAALAVLQEAAPPDVHLTATPLRTSLDFQMKPFQACALVAMALGIAALLLAGVGLAGVITYVVNQRIREMGIRLAIGASPADNIRLVLWQGGRLVSFGVLLGAIGAVAASRLFTAVLAGLSPFDPIAYAAVGFLLAMVSVIATGIPAFRASRVDPIVALRQE